MARAVIITLAIGLCGASGIAMMLAIGGMRSRRARTQLEHETATLHRRLQASNDALAGLREQVAEVGPAVLDAQRRWGFDLSNWPALQELIGHSGSEATSWWLLQHAPGAQWLSDGCVATERFHVAFDGWRPPRLPEGQ